MHQLLQTVGAVCETRQPRQHTGPSLLEYQIVVFKALMLKGTGVLLSQPQGIDELLHACVLVIVVTALWCPRPALQRAALLLPVVDIVGTR